MSNKTVTGNEAPFFDLGLGLPLWVIIVWAAVAFLITVMVVLILYVCHTRKSVQGDESINMDEEEEIIRQRSITLIETYPQGFIEELHTVKQSTTAIFPPAFVHNMRIPRATEVKMTASENGVVKMNEPHHSAIDNSGLTLDELSICISNFDHPIEEDLTYGEHHRKINISREASFRTSNISEENKARQILREKMVVNELREKIRRERRTIDEETKW